MIGGSSTSFCYSHLSTIVGPTAIILCRGDPFTSKIIFFRHEDCISIVWILVWSLSFLNSCFLVCPFASTSFNGRELIYSSYVYPVLSIILYYIILYYIILYYKYYYIILYYIILYYIILYYIILYYILSYIILYYIIFWPKILSLI